MSDEAKDKGKFEFPMMPIFGVDLGERLGSLAEGQKQLGHDLQKLDARMDKFEARMDNFEARMDKMAYALNRLDERTKNLDSKFNLSIGLTGAVLAAVIAGFIVQIYS